MSTGTMTGTDTGTVGVRRPSGTRDRAAGRAYTTTPGVRTGGTRRGRRHIVPPRTGSRQQVSVRGRRVVVRDHTGSQLLKLVIPLVLLAGLGVAAAMLLSARTTDQAFALQTARDHSATLTNELESLNRDYKELSSAENLMSEASRLGMVVPGQAGVLAVQEDKVNEIRPADASRNGAVIDLDATRRGTPAVNHTSAVPAQWAPSADVGAPERAQPGDVEETVAGHGVPAPQTDSAGGVPVGVADEDPVDTPAATQTGQLPYPSQSAVPAG